MAVLMLEKMVVMMLENMVVMMLKNMVVMISLNYSPRVVLHVIGFFPPPKRCIVFSLLRCAFGICIVLKGLPTFQKSASKGTRQSDCS
jgi:hypothetical protein